MLDVFQIIYVDYVLKNIFLIQKILIDFLNFNNILIIYFQRSFLTISSLPLKIYLKKKLFYNKDD